METFEQIEINDIDETYLIYKKDNHYIIKKFNPETFIKCENMVFAFKSKLSIDSDLFKEIIEIDKINEVLKKIS